MAIPIEKLKQVTDIYVHANCPDGLASAMILKDAFRMLGMSPSIEFLMHGTEAHKNAGREVTCSATGEAPPMRRPLFCDISPYNEYGTLAGCRDNGAIVLDHHVGTREIVESFGTLGVYADAERSPGVCGAVLAYREVWYPICLYANPPRSYSRESAEVERFADSVGARDTWHTNNPEFMRGQWISKALMSKPAAHWLEHRANRALPYHVPFVNEREVEIGQALFEAHENAVAQAVEQCVIFEVPEHYASTGTGLGDTLATSIRLAVFQEQASGFRLCSDVAEALRQKNALEHMEGAPVHVVAGFSYVVDKPGGKPKLVYSLRGLDGFDVCALAKANGGGGHKAASGFAIGFPDGARDVNPYDYIRNRLGEFLGAR